jgi:Ni/Fe-hydrogenase 1 B-type cytochrome subunit
MSAPNIDAGMNADRDFLTPKTPVEYRRVYVWELPVRVYHWINAVALVLLCITGYLIGAPLRAFYAAEAYQQYWFGCVRFVHFVAAFVYVFNFLARIYWGFAGNRYARWTAFFPLKPSQRQEIVDVIKADVFETKLHGPISTGHNALAGLIYFFTFLAFVAQTITGFALYSSMSTSRLPRLFVWVVPLLGGEFGVRFWHHLFLWFFVAFVIVHVYLAFYHDYIEGRGTVSSIIGGWKFERETSGKTALQEVSGKADLPKKSATMSRTKTLVLGLGNVLMGDEGVGVHVVRALEQHKLPDGVKCLDGGTGGFTLLQPLEEADRILIVDACADDNALGTVTRITPHFSRDFPPSLAAHDIGIKDLLDAFYMRGGKHEVVLYAITIDPAQPISMSLSDEATQAADEAVARILKELKAKQ